MTYHINNDGNIGKCDARISCPFGDFETHHYVTKTEARAAYEAAMEGNSFATPLEQSDPKEDEELQSHLAKLREKAGEPPLITPVLRGYFGKNSDLGKLKPGDEYDGKMVLQTHLTRHRKPREDGRLATYEIILGPILPPGERSHSQLQMATFGKGVKKLRLPATLDGEVLVEGAVDPDAEPVWIDGYDPEVVAAKEAQAREYGLSAARESVLDSIPRFRRNSEGRGNSTLYHYKSETYKSETSLLWHPRKTLKAWVRWHGERVEAAQKAGVANPEQLAYAQLEQARPKGTIGYRLSEGSPNGGDQLSIDVLKAVLDRDDSFKPSELQDLIIRETWSEGERPFVDYSMEDLGITPKVERDPNL